jgi:hypothetical protein
MDCPYTGCDSSGVLLKSDGRESLIIRHQPDAGLVEAEVAAFDGFWQCQTLDTGSRAAKPATFGAPRTGIADFVVIQTHLSLGF